ncbi:MAG: cobyrinate a,c-diamide synthase [Deltaproteobacteria bacterium]|nr:cobyrinate a,c-diamide synthase [Deltaproteobacteria bacterium]
MSQKGPARKGATRGKDPGGSAVPYPRLVISAFKKSSGKTLFALGLTRALKNEGLRVRAYKKGPDYIDPMWLKAASGQESYNLDPYLMGEQTCRRTFLDKSRGFDLSIIEGNHGLHDGIDLEGRYSTAALARTLQAPVLLVMDSTGMNRNIAALVLGLKNMDPQVDVAGVILNNVRSARQEQKQIQAIERYCGLPVLGSLRRNETGLIKERHLGLITTREETQAEELSSSLADLVSSQVDLAAITELARRAPGLPLEALPFLAGEEDCTPPRVIIAVASDPAFCFSYPDNLEALRRAGARLVFFNTMTDSALPAADGLYIPGGFPESYLKELEANKSLREDIRLKLQQGLPAYAECGGLIYLARSIEKDGVKASMVGAIGAEARFNKKPAGYGYVEFSARQGLGWFNAVRELRGHEFHYSQLYNLDPGLKFAYNMKRGTGIGEGRDGLVQGNLLASFTHLHEQSVPEWSRSFVDFIYSRKCGAETPELLISA